MVIDWKTGSRERGEDKVERQLNYYAPFVVEEYGVPYEQIELVAAWIGDCAEFSSFEPIPGFVESHSQQWIAWRQDLRMRTIDVELDRSLLDTHFPVNSDPYRCRYCKYQSCPGFARFSSEGESIAGKEADILGMSDTGDY